MPLRHQGTHLPRLRWDGPKREPDAALLQVQTLSRQLLFDSADEYWCGKADSVRSRVTGEAPSEQQTSQVQ